MLTDPETDPLAAIRSEFDRHRAAHRRGRFPERLSQCAGNSLANTASSVSPWTTASKSTVFVAA
jgi:hypothetical protein